MMLFRVDCLKIGSKKTKLQLENKQCSPNSLNKIVEPFFSLVGYNNNNKIMKRLRPCPITPLTIFYFIFVKNVHELSDLECVHFILCILSILFCLNFFLYSIMYENWCASAPFHIKPMKMMRLFETNEQERERATHNKEKWTWNNNGKCWSNRNMAQKWKRGRHKTTTRTTDRKMHHRTDNNNNNNNGHKSSEMTPGWAKAKKKNRCETLWLGCVAQNSKGWSEERGEP